MRLTRFSIFVLMFLTSFNLCASTSVIRHPSPGESLEQRWKWAINQAHAQEFKNGFWIGYSIKRLMGDHESIGSFDDDHTGLTLTEIITGIHTKQRESRTTSEEAQRILNEMERSSEKKIWKEVAILFQYKSNIISRINLSNMDLQVDLKNLPVIWLGSAENPQSINFLRSFYQNTSELKRREELIVAIAIHQSPDLVIPFLKGIVTGEHSIELRKSAVFWLGQTQEPAALKVLLNVVGTASPAELRKSAVFSISQMKFPEAYKALIDLATQKENREVRMEAIFWIAQQGFDQAPKILEQIVFQDPDEEVQRKAVFSVSQLKKKSGIPILIKIATNHQQSNVREEAVFWIGQIGNEAEGEMLEKITYQDPNREVRKKAIFSISQMKNGIGISPLERIGKTHQEAEMRKEAVFWLSQMKDPRARNALLQILKK